MGHLDFLHRDRYLRMEENEFRVEVSQSRYMIFD